MSDPRLGIAHPQHLYTGWATTRPAKGQPLPTELDVAHRQSRHQTNLLNHRELHGTAGGPCRTARRPHHSCSPPQTQPMRDGSALAGLAGLY